MVATVRGGGSFTLVGGGGILLIYSALTALRTLSIRPLRPDPSTICLVRWARISSLEGAKGLKRERTCSLICCLSFLRISSLVSVRTGGGGTISAVSLTSASFGGGGMLAAPAGGGGATGAFEGRGGSG